jgi:hypothetical protein
VSGLDLLTAIEAAILAGASTGATPRGEAVLLARTLLHDERSHRDAMLRGVLHETIGVYLRDLCTSDDPTALPGATFHLERAREEYREAGDAARAVHAAIATVTALVNAGEFQAAAALLAAGDILVDAYYSGDPCALIEVHAREVTLHMEIGSPAAAVTLLRKVMLRLSEAHEATAMIAARRYALGTALLADDTLPRASRVRRASLQLEESGSLLAASSHPLFESILNVHWAELHLDDGELAEAERCLALGDQGLKIVGARNRHAERVRHELDRRL